MLNFLDRLKGKAYALLRIVSGFMFAFHGAQKLFGVWSQMPRPAVGTQLWFAGIIELVGGLAVLLGLRSRLFALVCSGEMAVAYIQVHWRGRFDVHFFPTINQGELALLYCFVFLVVATHGSGEWSLGRGK